VRGIGRLAKIIGNDMPWINEKMHAGWNFCVFDMDITVAAGQFIFQKV
jgi:hypothetical protein